MPFTFTETPDSRQESFEPPGYTLIYKAAGEVNDFTVMQHAYLATPQTVYRPSGVLYRKDIRLDPAGWGQYLVTVPYGKLDKKSIPTGSASFSASVQGSTVNVKLAKEHIATYPSSEPNHGGAISVKKTSDGSFDVEGIDILIPQGKVTYTFKHPLGIVTEAFQRLLFYSVGKTNSVAFRGYPAGTLLFAGFDCGDGTDTDATVTYEFVVSPNESNISQGGITGISKNGHDVAWVEYEDQVSSGYPVQQARAVHVERVYDSFDFASVFGWS